MSLTMQQHQALLENMAAQLSAQAHVEPISSPLFRPGGSLVSEPIETEVTDEDVVARAVSLFTDGDTDCEVLAILDNEFEGFSSEEFANLIDVAKSKLAIADDLEHLVESPVEIKPETTSSASAVMPPDQNGEFPTPLDGALWMASLGIPQTALRPRTKIATSKGWPESATTNAAEIRKKVQIHPGCNFGSVAKAGKHFVFEADSPEVRRRFQVSGNDFTSNLIIQSRPGRGHRWYLHAPGAGNISQTYTKHNDFSIRAEDMYTVSPGSIHPETGKQYAVLVAGEPKCPTQQEIDFWNSERVEKKYAPAQEISRNLAGKVPHGSVHGFLVSTAGKLRRDGLTVQEIEPALLRIAHEQCQLPLDDSKIVQVARSMGNYEAGQNTDLIISPSQTPSTVQTTKQLNVQHAANISPKRVKWLWPHRVPVGKLTLFVGVPGSGKSLISGDVAARLSTGRDWFDSRNLFAPSETLMLVGEDDVEDTTIPRLQAAQADLSKIYFLKSVITVEGPGKTVAEREVQFDRDLIQIEEYLKDHAGIRLVIVDPVSNYMGDAKMNQEQEVRREVLIPLKNMAERLNVAVIAVMHLNKKVETSAINRVGGAMAFIGVARAAYLFQAGEGAAANGQVGDQHFMVLLKCNITKKIDGLIYEIGVRTVDVEGSPEWLPYAKFTGTTTQNAEGLLQPKSEQLGRPAVESREAEEWLKSFLVDGAVASKDVEEAGKELHNFSKSTIDRAKAKLSIVSEKQGRKWLWSLPVRANENSVNLNAPVEQISARK